MKTQIKIDQTIANTLTVFFVVVMMASAFVN